MSSAIGFLLCNFARLKKYPPALLLLMFTLLFASHGIAQNIDEVEPNSTFATAQDITASFSRVRSVDILHSVFLPSVSITATGDDTADYFKFDVTDVNSSYIFDIDYGQNHGGSFDSYIYLQNSSGGNYATNNNASANVGGLGSIAGQGYDAYLKYKFTSAGTYYLKVIRAYRSNVDTGATYKLQVSKESSTFIVDVDDDGMSDDWESFFSITDPSADLDADGYSNLDEFTQGSDPSFTDSDNDGLANAEDDDDDNDGVLDVDDVWSLSFAAAIDADADGHPDSWNSGCNDQCIADSGVPALDQFPQHAGAWLDADLDGRPDACSDDCESAGLIIDTSLLDFDNDGSPDLVDTDDDGDGIVDIDVDSDGLIEIDSLEKLNAMRYKLAGAGLQLTSNGVIDISGCPSILYQGTYQRRCSGYELTQDLDFDSNSDGILDDNDLYWNANSSGEGLGWSPVGNNSGDFSAIFDGNNFAIKNLYINRPTQNYIGLFGRINNATIRNVSLVGSLAEINGRSYVAGLSGWVDSNSYIVNSSVAISVSGYDYVGGLGGYSQRDNIFEENYNANSITGDSYVGGLVGYSNNASAIRTSFNTGGVTGRNYYTGGLLGYGSQQNIINNSFNSGAVEGSNQTGGLVGRLNNDNQINFSYSTGVVSGGSNTGGLIGHKSGSGTVVSQSFWATDSSSQASSHGVSEATGYVGLPLAILKCAIIANTTSDNSSCVSADGSAENLNAALTLYSGWESSSVWGFGTSDQLPALTINTMNYRDNDADGSIDAFDEWPNNAAASVDIDGDGHPDKWSIGCDDDCIANSGLPALDQFPQHAGAWLDADFDGRPDEINGDCTADCDLAGLVIDTNLLDFDNDASPDLVDTDDNGDGIQDIDADSNGLIDINSLEKLNAMRYELAGIGLQLDTNAGIDSSGCPFVLHQGSYQKRCRGYELTQDLDFDSNLDGVIDENDLYWNADNSGEGLGWSPIGNNSSQFSTTFEGNNFEIRNLYINRPTQDRLGLFGQINNATIQNVSLVGSLAEVRGNDYIGALVGSSTNNNSLLNVSVAINVQGDDNIGGLIGNAGRDDVIEGSSNSGNITGDYYIGGLIGQASSNNLIEGSFNRGKVTGNQNVGGLIGRLSSVNTMRTSFNTGAVIGQGYVGGLAGYADSNNIIVDTFSSGSVEGNSSVGGLVGRLDGNNRVNSSYSTGVVKGTSNVGGLIGTNYYSSSVVSQSFWAIDSTNQVSSARMSEATGYVGLPLATLKCAVIANTTSDNSSCVSADGSAENLNAALTLFSDWETSASWTFGASDQLPALVINTVNYRDNDVDGSVDSLDVWPSNSAGSLDADEDGHPDAWSIGCDDQCIIDSGLPALDQFPQHAGAWLDADFDGRPDACSGDCESAGLIIDTDLLDFDNDGSPDLVDADDNNDGIQDVDADSDGLIDIDSLEKLNAMRFQLAGIGLQLDANSVIDSAGCPFVLYRGTYQQRCIGYELTQSLNFDSNLDGTLDENDLYWNANNDGLGLGWSPVGTSTQYSFTATFNGNGHLIENLFINRSSSNGVGLFGYTDQSTIKNVGLTGRLGSISGSTYTGGLVGSAILTDIEGVFNTLPISGNNQVAGLVGSANGGRIANSFNSGSISCTSSYCGGVYGYIQGAGTLVNSFSTGRITSSGSQTGGLVGNNGDIQNSYWATDSSNQPQSSGQDESTSYVGITSAKMRCAVSADTTSANSVCVSADGSEENLSAAMTLYSTWGTDFWDFGSVQQLPALKIGTSVYRDADGDGFLDADDGMPLRIESSLDNDGDGYPDAWNATCDEQCISASGLQLDRFPNHAGAWQDDDLDGRPDSINETCTVSCDLAGLELDTNPALSDADNDGIADAVDTDDNGDDIVDADANSNGLIDIDSLEKLNAMRYQLTGVGLQLTEGTDVDRSGCPVILFAGAYEQRCSGYELTQSLDFDSNQDDDITAGDLYSNVNSSGVVEGWLPVGNSSLPFSTVFNGNNFEIKNLFINRTNNSNVGLFAFLGNANISNITFSGHLGLVSGNQFIGVLAGQIRNNNTLLNIQNKTEVRGQNSYTGGIAGGLYANNSVSLLSNLAKIEGNSSNVGGLFGYAESNVSISDSYNAGLVAGTSDVGGLVGRTGGATLKGVFNTGNISGASDVGGLVGELGNSATMSSAFNTGTVTGSGSRIGGLVGRTYYIGALSASFNTGAVIGGTETGGLVGYYNGGSRRITNSYWATDTSGQASSGSELEIDGYVGLTLEALKCAIAANTNSDSGCVSVDGSAEGLAAALTLYKDWELKTYTNEAAAEVPYWVFDGANQLPGLSLQGTIYRDSDNDQILDALDGFPLIAIGDLLDTDNDGSPDECDADCTSLGMTADLDDDNDGVLDTLETLYPLISLAGRADFDGDGVPDSCGPQCISLGMTGDDDSDNDGILDIADGYPLISIGALADLDGDGIPNDCDQACLDLGMMADTDDDNDGSIDSIDAYPLIAVGSLDTDHDGFPNDCDQTCIDLGMVADTDDDNDGTIDSIDAYPLIAVGSLDTDRDGIPNDCDQACLDLGMLADTDDDNDGILDTADFYPLIAVVGVDTDRDGIPNDCDQACNILGMVADTDDDNDGSADTVDAYPLIAVGGLDTDHDGMPNDCNQACMDLGMVADSDDDNDGIVDTADAYPLLVAGSLDTDRDGIPNDCDQVCLDLGMEADTDDDNDGIVDTADAYPLLVAGSLDTDRDGIPNDCDQTCIDLGMIADVDDDADGIVDTADFYPLIAVVGLDTDSDGIPNDCDQSCQLLGMVSDTDDDNDGSPDTVDAYPLLASGSLDTDLDGIPNDCDQVCLDLGVVADTDDDNDGLFDAVDAYPLIAVVGLDTDHDGIPNDCDQACLDLGMVADTDDDNDGLIDINDAYPLIAVGSLDTDLDGIPNDCDQVCLDLGMVADGDDDNDGSIDTVDAYPLIASGSLDTDLDGIPNECDQVCIDLGMLADTDDDNDGSIDTDDAYSLIASGSLDTDLDGIPNECDQACLDLGMVADNDDDNDGVIDIADAYPLIVVGSLDTDLDGIPNDCDQVCLDLGMVADTDDDNDGSIDANDAYPLITVGSLDTDLDGIPNDCDQVCLDLGMVTDTDDDNDGAVDTVDAYPLIASGSLDSDLDGIPNECDRVCIDLGMIVDTDDDNDGILDAIDGYPLIAIGGLADIDADGIPNDCDQVCMDLGMHADNDNDNDGSIDSVDAYPLIASGSLDTDFDGIPNECDQACLDLGMVADTDDDNDGVLDADDAFALNYAASVDADNDGLPDAWAESCHHACQNQSGLDLDELLADSDNDGMLDVNDPDLTSDNGLPDIISGPEDMHLAVNTDEGEAVLLSAQQVAALQASFVAVDAVDSFSLLSFKAYMNNVELVENGEGKLLIPSGLQVINWLAVDSSGNESVAHEQKIYVYPRLSFKQANSVFGDDTVAEVVVELSGPAPQYPVKVNIRVISSLTTVTQDDFGAQFSISDQHIVVIEAGVEATLNTQASLVIPILDNEIDEREEVLFLELKPFVSEDGLNELIKVRPNKTVHELKVTYENLAPVVTLLIKQNGMEVSEIIHGAGAVVLEALISDGNGADTHSIVWDVNELGLVDQVESVVELGVDSIPSGQYRISITAEDDGANPLSATLVVDVLVVAAQTAPESPAKSSKSSGGAIFWMLIMLMGLAVFRQQRAFGRHETR
jgi:hypothetical protein